MPRPKKCRWVNHTPGAYFFKPSGVPMSNLTEVHLTMDEMEAMRLSDVEAKGQAEAAPLMGISRQTFGRILAEAHRKVARAIVEGHAIHIEGGVYAMEEELRFICERCDHVLSLFPGMPSPSTCPECGKRDMRRT